MNTLTQPPISIAQNRPDAQRLLAAQAVLYSRAKTARNLRIAVTVIASVALGIAAAVSDDADVPVGVVGGILILFISQYAAYRLRSTTDLAVLIQEKFDTDVYQIGWNSVVLRSAPTSQMVASAASRCDGNRTADWYPDTKSVARPLDVIICQQANLGWGAAIHRKWASLVAGTSVLLVIALGATWWFCHLSSTSGLNILVLPVLPLLLEAVEEFRRHFESARLKEETQQTVLDVWREGLSSTGTTDARCREIQNEIVHIRQSNAQVPDWFDRRFRTKSEAAMRVGADDMIEEARRHHKA